MTLDGMPAGLAARHRRAQRAAAPPPGRLRPRPPHADRKRPRRDARGRPPRRDDRRADRPADPQSRLGQLAADDVRRGGDAGGRHRRQPPDVTRPRPGHADLAGAIKYGHDDIRDVLERASARETAARVAAGSARAQLLGRFGVRDREPRRRPSAASRCRPTRAVVLRRSAGARQTTPAALRGRRPAAADDRGDRRARGKPATRSAARSK